MIALPTPDKAADDTAVLPQPALAAQALALLLKPLARLMIDHGLQLPDILELLKKSLVDEAGNGYGQPEKASTDTRIAVLTGVHRKDVKRLRDATQTADLSSPTASLAALVVARWISNPHYLNADQTPRLLARTPKRGKPGEPDFTQLVADISRDVGGKAVLDELHRLGVVSVQEDGYVSLKAAAFVPKEGLSESFHFLANNLHDHLASAVHNLAPDRTTSPMLEQSAFSANLTDEQARQLHDRARQLWGHTLQQFLQTATVAEQRSQHNNGPKHRIRFGVYFHDTVQDSPPVSAGKVRHKRPPLQNTKS